MTMAEIKASKKDFLTPAEISEALGAHPQTIRLMARDYPERVGYPYTFCGKRMLIPREGFIRWAEGRVR